MKFLTQVPVVAVPFLTLGLLAQSARVRNSVRSPKATAPCPQLAGVPSLVINLDRRPDRFSKFAEMVHTKQPWLLPNMCRLRAVDGAKLPNSLPARLIDSGVWAAARERTANKVLTVGGPLTVGAVGLITSHALAWMEIVRMNVSKAIVFEDDLLQYSDDFAHALCHKLPKEGWDVFQLQGDEVGWPKHGKRAHVPTTVHDGAVVNAAMYLMTREGAKRALQQEWPMREQLDAPNNGFHQLSTLRFVPPIAQAADSDDSDVQIRHSGLIQEGSTFVPDCSVPTGMAGLTALDEYACGKQARHA